jgi:predicted amidohydrolase YtcJ
VLIGSLEKAMKRKPRKDHRTVLVHFGFAAPEQVRRWAQLGGIVSANPYYVTALAGCYANLGIGPERSKNMVPLGDVLKNHVSLSFHSDMPMAPAKPLQLIWAAVNRFTAEGPVSGPEHRVPLGVALESMTLDAAHSIQLEKEIGSIEVGKWANLTILEKSPYDVPPEQLKEISVWGTMLEGRVQPAPAAPKTALKAGSSRLVAAHTGEFHSPADAACRGHADGGCCACAMNRAFAQVMADRHR